MDYAPTAEDFAALAQELTPEDLARLGLIPEEQALLEQQLREGEALAQPSSRRYSTPTGALLGGAADVLKGIIGAQKAREAKESKEKSAEEEKRIRTNLYRALTSGSPIGIGEGNSSAGQASPLGAVPGMQAQGGSRGGFVDQLRADPSPLLLSGDPALARYAEALLAQRRQAAERERQAQQQNEHRRMELADKQSSNTEWNRRNDITSVQELERARILAGQQAGYAAAARRDAAAIHSQDRADAAAQRAQDKADALAQKSAASMAEVEGRFQTMKSNIAGVRKMIEDKGTYELLGPHNDILNQKLNDIATDYAKLVDPSSVARESEVESAKKNLPRIGFGQSNSTALDVLKSFEDSLGKRRGVGYQVRGLEVPRAVAPTAEPKQRGRRVTMEDGSIWEEMPDGSAKRVR